MSPVSVSSNGRPAIGRFLGHPVTLWIAFLVVHLILGQLALTTGDVPLGDVTSVYKQWALQAEHGGPIVGIQTPWVYPLLALVPILAPLAAGDRWYAGGWLTMVLLFDAVAFAVVIFRRTPRRIAAAWWWLVFLLLLGPIAVSRLDTVTASIAIVAVLVLAARPRLATVLLTVATWVKVWPAAILAAMVVAMRCRWRILGTAVVTSVGIVAVGLVVGGGPNMLSFISAQADRGLQIEAPISTPWMWAAGLHLPGSFIYFDRNLVTFQVTGDGINTAVALMTPLLVLATLAVLLIGLRAVNGGRSMTRVLPALSLALVTTTIALNKVGSPQYLVWLAAPVIAGLVCQGRAFRTPAILVAVTAGLTQVFYPVLYDVLLNADLVLIAVLTIRNLMFFVLLGWALFSLWHDGRTVEERDENDQAPRSRWPFAHESP